MEVRGQLQEPVCFHHVVQRPNSRVRSGDKCLSLSLCKATWNNMMLFYPKLKFKIIYLNLFLFCLHIWSSSQCMVSSKAKRGHWISWSRSYRGSRAVMWVLGTKSRSSGRAVSMSVTEPSLPSQCGKSNTIQKKKKKIAGLRKSLFKNKI